MDQPLVSVICLSYNHQQFLREAIQSVWDQTYTNIQLIVVDDGSSDDSRSEIEKTIEGHPEVDYLPLPSNLGNCVAFNRGLAKAKGDYIIDLAADDVMIPDRIERQVKFFETLPPEYGVVFTDADYIDAGGKFIRGHFDYLFANGLLTTVPQGDIYRDVLYRYFIASPTMMIKRAVMDHLKGYDEELAYEDFDFWVRSARDFSYAFLNEKLTKIRRTGKSMSSGWYKKGDRQLHSTYLVCRKARKLSRSKEDDEALVKRVRYELRQSFFSENFYEAKLFYGLLKDLVPVSFGDRLIMTMTKIHLRTGFVRHLYQKIKYRRSNLP